MLISWVAWVRSCISQGWFLGWFFSHKRLTYTWINTVIYIQKVIILTRKTMTCPQVACWTPSCHQLVLKPLKQHLLDVLEKRLVLTFVTIMTTKPFSSILYSDTGWSSFNIFPEKKNIFQWKKQLSLNTQADKFLLKGIKER